MAGKDKGSADRYRNYGDPISMFDRSATNSLKTNIFSSGSMTHDFTNIADQFNTSSNLKTLGVSDDDNSIVMTE